MKIDGDNLIIDESLNDENIEEFVVSLNQNDLKKVIIENDDISAGIIQVLWCSDKEVEVKSPFLNKFFENVRVIN